MHMQLNRYPLNHLFHYYFEMQRYIFYPIKISFKPFFVLLHVNKDKLTMKEDMPLILISNDDGYHSKGIRSLVDMVKDLGDVIVCAPESARSGFSCAFSATIPLEIKERHNMGDTIVWSCNGTPVDCIKIALDQFYGKKKPNIILGGINHGDNSSVNAHYSGTMGIVMEGCMKGIPSVAFSLCDEKSDADFSPLRYVVRNTVTKVLTNGLPTGVCLNINFPKTQHFAGIKYCRMAMGTWVNEIVKAHHPRNYDYFWMVGHYQLEEPNAKDTDRWALSHNYVAVTPTSMDITNYEFLNKLRTKSQES
jgi:5'-nucleotidase